MKYITLSQGYLAIVDDADYQNISSFKWAYARGYALRSTFEKGRKHSILMHRFIMCAPKGLEVDHINGNKLDNRKSNLRLCLRSQNGCNCRRPRIPTSSIYKGVHYEQTRKLWRACIKSRGKSKHIGRFHTEQEAALAYNKAAIEYHGEYANLNKIQEEKDYE